MAKFDDLKDSALRAMRLEGRSRDVRSAFAALPTPGRADANRAWQDSIVWLLSELRSPDAGQAYELVAIIGQDICGLALSPDGGGALSKLDAQRHELETRLFEAACGVAGYRVQDLPELEERGAAATWATTLCGVRVEVEQELAVDFDEERMTAQRRALVLIDSIVSALAGHEDGETTCPLCDAANNCSRCGGLRRSFDGTVAA